MASTRSFILLTAIVFLFCELRSALDCKTDSFFKDAEPRVKINDGSIKGKHLRVFESDIAAFLGIPYAKPPVGRRRFQKAAPMKPWKGELLANKKPPPCMQYSSKNYSFISTNKPSEDCLYLNVWMPMKKCCGIHEFLQVLVWVHGGAFAFGSTDIEIYDGGVIASRGDAVVVSMNYRVGIFGFLNAGIEDAPGNMGLDDQNLAMKWVKENIHYFGGDPNKISLFGESAGAISISLHLVAPLSRNLFKRAIMQSGTAFHPQYVDPPSVAFMKGKAIAQMVGCLNRTDDDDPITLVHCLKLSDAMTLSEAEDKITSKSIMFFKPSYGNWFLPVSPIKSFFSGDISQLDVLMGVVKDEGSIFLNFKMPELFPMDQTPDLSLSKVQPIFGELMSLIPWQNLSSIFDFYFQGLSEKESMKIAKALSDSLGDYMFNCPMLYLAERLKRVHMYYITYRSHSDPSAGWLGVQHFSEVPFVFGVPIIDDEHYTSEDGQFSEDILQKWVSFAKTGSPTDEKVWPLFSSSEQETFELSAENSHVIANPHKEACELWRPFLTWR
ncbi:Acetylcholinesterase [Araneus ventricosus]|uniref:Carboxylic ester hydrolase n=1 Tax=Araneus ventricosus TaxID=182803 RepID=A0A4Y2GIT3_ARAVE|nr:Acetylcholinesterase [Araneus ventricosus]